MKVFAAAFLLLISFRTNATDFSCPVPVQFQNLSCEGSVEVKTIAELNDYKLNLAQKKGKARNLVINFDINTTALTVSTPCKITLNQHRSINTTGDLCFHGNLGVNFDESSFLRANNIRLESNQKIWIEDHADIKAHNLELLSLGNTEDSRAHIRDNAKVDVTNLLLEAFDRVSLASNSTYNVAEEIKLFSRGDDNASIGSNTRVVASTFELLAYDKVRIANNVNIKADTVIINGSSCAIVKNTIVIDAAEKLGNCFLQSSPKGLFTFNKNSGPAPLTVTFNASKVVSAKYVWSFGNGQTLTTTNSIITYTYIRPGSYTVTMKYLNGQKYKSAGAAQITVKQANFPPVANLSCLTNNLLVDCNAMASYSPQGVALTFTFDYGDGFSETNTTGLSSHPYSLAGLYTIKLTVSDLAGLTTIATTQVQPMLPPNQLPQLVLNCSSAKPNALDCNAVGSHDVDGTIVTYHYVWDDQTSDTKADSGVVSHSFTSSGSHSVNLIAVDNDGGVSTLAKTFVVKDNSIPVADFQCESTRLFYVKCTSTSIDADFPNDSLTNYTWDFGNNNIFQSAGSVQEFTFLNGGSKTISLSVADSFGGVGQISKVVQVKDNLPPAAFISCTTNNMLAQCNSLSSYDPEGQAITYAFDFGDNTTDFNTNGLSTHAFSTPGLYQVKVKVTDSLGAFSIATTQVQAVLPPNKLPTSNLSCISNSPFKLECNGNGSQDLDGTIVSYKFLLDDGTEVVKGTSEFFTHNFQTAGTHVVTLIVTDNDGGTGESVINTNVLSNTAPIAQFKCEPNYLPQKIKCSSSSYDLDIGDQIVEYSWTVGDNDSVKTLIPIYDTSLSSSGTYNVKLDVKDSFGGISTLTKSYTIVDSLAPAISFQYPTNKVFDSNVDQDFFIQVADNEKINFGTVSLFANDVKIPSANYSIDQVNNKIQVHFRAPSLMNLGANTITAKVQDSSGNTTSANVIYQLSDELPPQISVLPIAGTHFTSQNGEITFTFTNVDDANWNSLSVRLDDFDLDSSVYKITGNKLVLNVSSGALLAEGDNNFTISLSDLSGNKATLNATYFLDSSSLGFDFIPESGTKFDLVHNAISIYPVDDTNPINWSTLKVYWNDTLLDSSKYSVLSLDEKISIPVDLTTEGGILRIEMQDSTQKNIRAESRYYLKNTTPPSINFSITDGTQFSNNSNPDISFNLIDQSDIDFNSLKVFLNDVELPKSKVLINSQNNQVALKLDNSYKANVGPNVINVSISDVDSNTSNKSLSFSTIDSNPPVVAYSPVPGSSFYSNIVSITASLSDDSEINWSTLEVAVNNIPTPLLNYYVDSNTVFLNLNTDYSFELGANTVSINVEDIWGNKLVSNVNYNLLEERAIQLGFSPDRNSHFKKSNPVLNTIFNFPDNVKWETLAYKLNDTAIPSSMVTKINSNTVSVSLGGSDVLGQGLNKLVVEYDDAEDMHVIESVPYFLDDIYSPVLALSPASGTFLATQDLNFNFNITDVGGINSSSLAIELNGTKVTPSDYSFNGGSGTGHLKLSPGTNTLKLSVNDKSGNLASIKNTYTVGDSTGPTYIFTPGNWAEFQGGSTQSFAVQIKDAAGISSNSTSIKLNGVVIPSNKLNWNATKSLLTVNLDNEFYFKGGTNIIIVGATDVLGHSSSQSISYKYIDKAGPSISFIPDSGTNFSNINNPEIKIQLGDLSDIDFTKLEITLNGNRLTNLDYIIDTSTKNIAINLATKKLIVGDNNLMIVALDSVGNSSTQTANYKLIDTIAPILSFDPAVGTFFTSQGQSIKMHFSDLSEIDWNSLSVKVNGSLVSGSDIVFADHDASVNFGTDLLFKQGNNTFVVQVTDMSGNVSNASANYQMDDIFPAEISFIPASGSVLTNTTNTVNVNIVDGGDLKWDTLSIKLNGMNIPSSQYVLSGNSLLLNFNNNFSMRKGVNRLEVSITDVHGNFGKSSASYIVQPAVPDLTPPLITITPGSGILTSSPSQIEVRAFDESGVDFTRVVAKLNNQIIPIDHITVDPTAGKVTVRLDGSLKLISGKNLFTVFLTDNQNNVSGNSTYYELVQALPIDTLPPVITFNPAGGEIIPSTPIINAFFSDESGIDYSTLKILINNSPLSPDLFTVDQVKGKILIQFTTSNPMPSLSSNQIIVQVKDKKGNLGEAKVGFDQVDQETFKVVNFPSNANVYGNCVILVGGKLKCWGTNRFGKLGLGSNDTWWGFKPGNMPFVELGEPVASVSEGTYHTCAATISGKVYCWGVNNHGQLGYGNTDNVGDNELPISVGPVPVGGEVTQLALGLSHTCALLKSGDVKCWGGNNGSLGGLPLSDYGDNENLNTVPNVVLGAKATQIVAGQAHTCALLESGDVKCFGDAQAVGLKRTRNTLGINPFDLPIVPLSGKVKQLSSNAQAQYTCALLVNGDVNCWGFSPTYALGYPGLTSIGVTQDPSSVGVVNIGGSVLKISVGMDHTCALLTDLHVKCWGSGAFEQNGYNYTIGDNELPSSIPPINYGNAIPVDISAETQETCLTFNDGTMKCWGYGGDETLGNGTRTNISASAVATTPSIYLGGQVQIPTNISAFFTSNPYFGPSPLQIDFDASKSISLLGAITNYHWNFGDGGVLDSQTAATSYIFYANGVYTSQLTITDSLGQTAIFKRTITVGPVNNPPFAFFNALSSYGVAPYTANFDASNSFDVNGTIAKYSWNFGDEVLLDTTTPITQHIYSAPGTYLAMLKVQDNSGATADAFPMPITVKEFNMSPFASSNCSIAGRKINCSAFSSGDMDGMITNYQWDFGDGLSTQGQSQFETTHSYMADGTFNVKLTIVDDSGATATYQVPVLIDTVAPNIISTLADNVITNDPNFHLSMIVDELNEAETNISQNGVVISTTHDHVIDEIVSLQEGLNVFTVDSIDGTGNKTHKTILSSILLDTAAPQLASISPPDGTEVSSQQIVVTGRFNEQISSLLINDVPATILADGQSFSYNYTAYSEGIHQLSLNASDMAGNSSLVTTTLNVQLKILYPELISISKLATGELKVTGSPGAAKENSEILIAAGMLNRKTVTAKADGSFEATLNYFTSVKVTATDPISGRSESTVINYNVDTTLAGTIKDTDGNPLPGVKVTLKDTDASPVLTNASGIFSFANPPTGDRQLIIDAQNVPVAAVGPNKKFSVLEIPVSIGSRQSNVIDAPIYLAPLMFNGTETVVENGVSTTVESAQVAGAAIEIPGSVQVNFPEGNTLKAINMAEISKDKTTVPVIKEVEPQTVVALEPSGLSFSEPVQLTLPNSNEFPAGMQVMIYSKNSKTGTWEIDGVARVDGNGEKIVTQDGMGITHFSEVYAAPMGLKYSQINSQDKPGADTFNGAVSTTIDFPGYKSMGAEIAPKLIYRSNWAHPTATVTNIFDLPTEVQFIDVDGKRVIKPMIGSFESQTGLTTWAIPEKVNLNYVIGDYHSDVMTLTGIPEKAVVSFGVDLQLQPSGILPFNASYEIHLKRMVIRTDNYLEVANGFRRGFKPEDLISFPEVIPASLTGNLYVQNKSTSKVGKGWMIGGVQKIVNPGSSRLMLEEDSGAVSTYVVDDKIQTILKTKSNFSGINILDNNQLALSDSTDSIYELNLDDGTKSTLLTAPQYSGAYSSSSTYTRNECTTWATVFGKGRICFSWSDRYYCRQSKANYQLTPTKKYSIASPGGTGYIVASEKGVISLHNGNSFEILTGKTKTAPTSDSDPFFCSSSASCTSKTIVNDFRNYPPCPTTPASTGQVYDQGYDDGPLGAARFNTIKSIASNPTANGFAVADYGNHRVRYVNLDTKIVTTIAGSGKVEDTGDGGLAIEAGINHPLGLAYDADGNLFVSNETGYIRKIDKTGHIVKFAGNPNGAFYDQAKAVDMFLSKPYGLTYDVDKNLLYAADSGNNRILKIDLNTNIVKNVAGNGLCQTETSNGEKGGALGASLCNPEFVELDENKNLIIADTGHNMIRRVIFSDSANGILKFDAVADDGSSLVRNSNGSFTRTFRSGVQVNFDGLGKHISTTDRVGRTVFNNYDGTGNLISQIDPVGGIISYEYEFLGGALSKIRYGNDGREFTFNHDNNLNLTSVNYPDGTAKQFSYKPDGLLIGETDQKNNSIAYNYNKWNRLQEVVRPDGNKITVNDSQSVSMVNNYTGGVTGSLKKQGTDSNQLADGIKDAKGITTTFVQDETGYVSTIIDGTGKTTLVARDDKGRPTEITRPDNSKVEFSYDQKTGDLLSKSDSLTKTTEIYIYDSFGNLISRTDGLGRKILIDYDSKGQLIKTTNEILGTSVTYTYNSLGLLSTQTDSLGQASSVIYDSKGNVLKAISPEGKETNYFYYSSGLVQKVTDANATNSQYEYDSMNRLLAVTTGGSQKTQYTYQETGELIQIVDPYSKLTNFYYDNLGQLTKKIGTRGEITELTYDENGNTSSEKTPNGQKKYFYYDNLDQLVRKLLPDDDYNFNYDVRGNVTSVRNLQTQIDFSYQHFDGGDIISQVHSYGIGNGTDLPNTALSYSYNEVGERIGMATPKGTFHYGRDAAGRLRNITNHKGEVFSMKYDLNQRLKEISSPAITTSFTFDSTGFNTQINHARKSGATIEKYIYGKDEVGNRISKTTSSGTSTYSYDKNYQLIKSVTPRLPDENFSYDSVGNRISDSNSTYAYDSSKQEVQEDYKYLYTFDANGNMTSKQEKNFTGNVQNFDYNSENQLRVFKLYKNGQLAREVAYTYDALGRRIEKTILDHEENSKSFTKRFAYDGSEILFELNENNSITQTYTHSTMRTDDPLAVANSQGTFYFVKDGLGSITDITDDSGFKVQHYDYSAFGKILAVKDGNGNDVMDAPPVDQSFSYTGREYDKESGLYYYRARYYDPNIGRFLSVDPDVGSLSNPITHINKYFYVGNNPINLVDPTGMSWKKFTRFATGVAIGSFLGPLGALAGGLILSQSDRAWNNVIKFAGSSEGQALIIITAGILTGGVAGVVLTGALLNANDTRRSKGGWKAVLTSAAIGGAVSYLGAGLVPSNFFGAAIVGAGIGYIGSVLTGGNMEGHVRAAEAGGASAAISNATAPPSNEGTGGSCYSFGLLDHSKPGCK